MGRWPLPSFGFGLRNGFLNESKELTDKLVDGLAAQLARPTAEGHASREHVLRQILVKHGRRYFDEAALLNEEGGVREGRVQAVLSKLGEMFLFFTVTVNTAVSNRSKSRVDSLRLVQVPVVLRVRPSPPTPAVSFGAGAIAYSGVPVGGDVTQWPSEGQQQDRTLRDVLDRVMRVRQTFGLFRGLGPGKTGKI